MHVSLFLKNFRRISNFNSNFSGIRQIFFRYFYSTTFSPFFKISHFSQKIFHAIKNSLDPIRPKKKNVGNCVVFDMHKFFLQIFSFFPNFSLNFDFYTSYTIPQLFGK